mmetsp:Transcript_48309/g.94382  ORF Transcript_48309/g.94382 Transcript_48309/m.94382 type:complete len:366 (+) Transcript_48309:80-1177(+)
MSRNTCGYNGKVRTTPTSHQLKSTDGVVSGMRTSKTSAVEYFSQENTTKSNKSLQRTGDEFQSVAGTEFFSSPAECVNYFGNLQQDLKDFLKEYNTVQRRPTPSPFQLLSNATPTIELVSALVSMKRNRSVSTEQDDMDNEEMYTSNNNIEMNSDKERENIANYSNPKAKIHKHHTYKQTCGADKLIEAQGELKNTTEKKSGIFSAPKKKKQLLERDENTKNETKWLRNEFRESDVTCNADQYNPNSKLKPTSKYSKSDHNNMSSATLSKPVLTFEIQKEHDECNNSALKSGLRNAGCIVHNLSKDLHKKTSKKAVVKSKKSETVKKGKCRLPVITKNIRTYSYNIKKPSDYFREELASLGGTMD